MTHGTIILGKKATLYENGFQSVESNDITTIS